MAYETPPPSRRSKTLYKDPIDKKIGGVASGVAKYFDVDTTLVRAIWAVAVLMGGFGLVLYLILWFILDDDPDAYADPIPARPVETAVTSESADESVTAGDGALETAREELETETFEADLEDAPTDT